MGAMRTEAGLRVIRTGKITEDELRKMVFSKDRRALAELYHVPYVELLRLLLSIVDELRNPTPEKPGEFVTVLLEDLVRHEEIYDRLKAAYLRAGGE